MNETPLSCWWGVCLSTSMAVSRKPTKPPALYFLAECVRAVWGAYCTGPWERWVTACTAVHLGLTDLRALAFICALRTGGFAGSPPA